MNYRFAYRRLIKAFEHVPVQINKTKTLIAEQVAIFSKKNLISKIQYQPEEEKKFKEYWASITNKHVSNKWHRLYEAINGQHRVDYLPDYLFATKVEPKLNDYIYTRVLEDKSLLESIFSGGIVEFPKTVLVRSNGIYYDKNRHPISPKTAYELLCGEEDIVCKPTTGSSSGQGIMFLKTGANFNSLNELEQNLGKDFIVQNRVKQHKSWSKLNPDSVNTLRVISALSTNGEMYFAPLALRIGRSGKNVDNIHAGGLCIGVDDGGHLLEHAYILGNCDNDEVFDVHPDNGIVFRDHQIVGVAAILDAVRELHGRLPHVGLVSWDFTVNEQGRPVLIEINLHGQSIWFSQIVHGKPAFPKKALIEFLG